MMVETVQEEGGEVGYYIKAAIVDQSFTHYESRIYSIICTMIRVIFPTCFIYNMYFIHNKRHAQMALSGLYMHDMPATCVGFTETLTGGKASVGGQQSRNVMLLSS